ncbi:hypothetical protein Psfp_02907 [Pelotomaculum sp. FP]|uniref:four-helix bundle copper-binding protein n=1 Tax=Pelotomaculum sp. FP TaxID=261474 RepID=UPI001064EF34|nr:four-helix bundle copper-binding protein [Pelotomaculum sp. FP]TEB14404.1 hypothetical protein Psfp_02907 [Pelotomaculum sp. FP]
MSENLSSYAYYPIASHEGVLKTVQNCEAVCENTFTAVLCMHDCRMRVMQLQLLRDCADICTLTAKYIARCSMYARPLAGLCAQICQDCGTHCLQHPDQQSQYCGQVCLKCAQECAAFAGMAMPCPGGVQTGPCMPGMPGMPGMFSQAEKKEEKE